MHIEIQELSPPPDPRAACERLRDLPERLLLDSARGGGHSYLMADPWAVVTDPLQLRERMRALERAPVPGLPPFQGGAAGAIEYEWRADAVPAGEAFRFGLYDWVIAWDHGAGRAWLISTGLPEVGDAGRRRANERASLVRELLDRPLPGRVAQAPRGTTVSSNFGRAGYIAAVEAVLARIEGGEVEQVNLSQRFEAASVDDPWSLYKRLRDLNPAPFAAFYDLGARTIASASPERFVQVKGGEVSTSPIKGTRPRGRDAQEDRLLAEELLGSEKDRRENELTVEGIRQELQALCVEGSVEVEAFCALERHPTVQHLVSTLRGVLALGKDPLDLLGGMFPGASIAGVPKATAMEAIAELERRPRGLYCGSIAWWSLGGDFDSSVLIRTIVVEGERLSFSAGGGIVEGSDPAAEWEETLHKARALMQVVEGR